MSMVGQIEAKIARDERRLSAWMLLEEKFNARGPVAEFVRVHYEEGNGRAGTFVAWPTTMGWMCNTSGPLASKSWHQVIDFLAVHERTPVRFECYADEGRTVHWFVKP